MSMQTALATIADLEAHPGRADLLGLRNLDQMPW
jgi:hypothetical protein